jgi:catechol 2,3-dioxygenase-like lactoylglutathione lyase family enzyme
MVDPVITGIQQIGVGNQDVQKAWEWARRTGSDLKLFDSADEADLMTRYTGGEVHRRHAIFALNLQGGGGLELWQFTSRESEAPSFRPKPGDTGILTARLKCKNIASAESYLQKNGVSIVGGRRTAPNGTSWFAIEDPFGNIYQIVEGNEWLLDTGNPMGGVSGAMIGVSNMERSIPFYIDVLGFDVVAYDKSGVFDDWNGLFDGHDENYRRVLLRKSSKSKGFFSELVDSGQIELVQALDRTHRKIFADRYWGDAGFIHLCFDVQNTDALKAKCEKAGYPFTVDSQSAFDMNEASGRFSYIEDPDGTLIEFVEAFKVPILKKIGWYLNLEKRNPDRPLPKFLFKAMSLTRSPI